MDLGQLFAIFMSAVFVQNYIFSRFLGLCPYVGVSKDTSSAMGMGFAVVFVMTMASIVTWILYSYVLVPLDLTYLKIVAFILVIASFVQFVEMFLKKTVPALHKALGIYLPLITTNCAVLGVAFLNSWKAFQSGFGWALLERSDRLKNVASVRRSDCHLKEVFCLLIFCY